jgi:hypothetical protein
MNVIRRLSILLIRRMTGYTETIVRIEVGFANFRLADRRGVITCSAPNGMPTMLSATGSPAIQLSDLQ